MRRLIRWMAVLTVAAAGRADAQALQQAPLYWWVQAGASGEWQLRSIWPRGAACPAEATVRAQPSADFPVLVCQQTLGGQAVQLPRAPRPMAAPSGVRRVVVIGDTGCRAQEQNCADPASWPFATVAGRAATAGGNLTVHVGDYIYREKCIQGKPGPCGDKWATWVADWFTPAGELLNAAPWVFARGNHEDCTRGGRGWFLFFDPRPVPSGGCAGTTDPYAVQVPGVGTLLILDSACAPWYSTGCWSATPPGGSRPANNPAQAIPAYAGQFRQLARLAPANGPAWMVTHVPLWVRDFPNQLDSTGAYILKAALRQASANGELPASVTLSLVGHVHAWEALDFAAPRAPVLVLGDGGTSESVDLPTSMTSPADGVAVEGYWSSLAFGYTVLDAQPGGGWRATLVRVTGDGAGITCTLNGGQLTC